MNDLEFVRRCIKRDAAAWDEFLRKYSKLIYNYIHSVLRIKAKDIPLDTVDDLFQEIISSLIKDNYRKLRMFKAKNNCSLASWLRVVTVNFMIDFIRSSKPLILLDQDLPDQESLKDIASDSYAAFEKDIADEEKRSRLSECIAELSVDDKYFLRLYIHKCVALDRLGPILSISKTAVDMRKSRIVERLRGCFKKKGFLLDS